MNAYELKEILKKNKGVLTIGGIYLNKVSDETAICSFELVDTWERAISLRRAGTGFVKKSLANTAKGILPQYISILLDKTGETELKDIRVKYGMTEIPEVSIDYCGNLILYLERLK